MERALLEVSLKDKIRNEVVRQRIKVTDIALNVSRFNWQWASCICHRTDIRWSKGVLDWKPHLGKRNVGRFLAK